MGTKKHRMCVKTSHLRRENLLELQEIDLSYFRGKYLILKRISTNLWKLNASFFFKLMFLSAEEICKDCSNRPLSTERRIK